MSVQHLTYLDSEQETKIYILVSLVFLPFFGQSWAPERAQRPQLETRYMNQRNLAREIDSKAPRKLKSGPESKSVSISAHNKACSLFGWARCST